MRIAALVVGLAIVGVAVGAFVVSRHSRHQMKPRPSLTSAELVRRGYPRWVRQIVVGVPKYYFYIEHGKHRLPRVVAVSFRQGQKTDLKIIFDREVPCWPCSRPDNAHLIRGTRLTSTYVRGSHQMLGFGFG